MKQLRQLTLGGLAILAMSASQGLNAATSDCFVPARDGSGIGDLHLLSSDPLEIGALAELKVSRASTFFRDTDLAGITADIVEGGDETQVWFTFTSKVDYEILINRTAHVGSTTTSPTTRAYLTPVPLLRAQRPVAGRCATESTRARGRAHGTAGAARVTGVEQDAAGRPGGRDQRSGALLCLTQDDGSGGRRSGAHLGGIPSTRGFGYTPRPRFARESGLVKTSVYPRSGPPRGLFIWPVLKVRPEFERWALGPIFVCGAIEACCAMS